MDILKKLKISGYLSLISLLFAWISAVLIILNEPNKAIISHIIAFIFDASDGFWARRLKLDSDFGRQMDSFVDIFTYLVFSSLFFLKFLTPNLPIGIIIGFFILSFGGLRLLRFNNEGILKDKEKDYYRGVTVLHISTITIISYYLSQYTQIWNSWFTTIILLTISPLMLSNYKTYKIKNYWLIGTVVLFFLILTVFLEYAYIK